MMTFRSNLATLEIPLGTVWLLTDIAEAKGRHDLLPWLNYFLATLKRAYRELEKASGRL